MKTALRVFAVISVMIVYFCIVGCGGDNETDSPTPTVDKKPEIKFGLDGDTYRNRRLFKISNLPIDDWTVKEVNKTVEGENEEDLIGWVPLPWSLFTTTYTRGEDFFIDRVSNGVISLLFMQPVSEKDFVCNYPQKLDS